MIPLLSSNLTFLFDFSQDEIILLRDDFSGEGVFDIFKILFETIWVTDRRHKFSI